MKPVNLLPAQHRPRQATGAKPGSAYAVVGVLAVLLLCVGGYVVTANRVTERKDKVAEAKRETAEAERKLASLGRYGDFAQIAATRRASVSGLSQARFDWERFLRELAHVLPRGMWLTGVDASMTGEDTSSTSPASSTADGEGKPGATLEGCAKRQPDVATLMVRLRKLHAVEEVSLEESARGDDAGSSSSSSSSSSGDCGRYYKFSVKTAFTATPAATPAGNGGGRVPAALGGGS